MTWALVAVAVAAGMGLPMIAMAVGNSSCCDRSAEAEGIALHCLVCGIDWPHDLAHYRRCPACLEPTNAVSGSGVQPLDQHAARSIRLHHEFERFYVAREQDGAA
jgi:hypothetical protein